MQTATAPLPAIVKMLGVDDAGAGASCPHCGATGRWIYNFLCEDGTQRAAMAGCLKQFPQMPEIARKAAYAKLRAQGGKTAFEKLTARQEAIRADIQRIEAKEAAVKAATDALNTFCRWMNDEVDRLDDAGEDSSPFRQENRATFKALCSDLEAAKAI